MNNPFRRESNDDVALLLAGMPVLAGVSPALVAFWFGAATWRGLRARFLFEEAACRIESGTIIPAQPSKSGQARPRLRFLVQARGASYPAEGFDAWDEPMSPDAAQVVIARFPPGAVAPCWHDPDDPGRAVLDRSLLSAWAAASRRDMEVAPGPPPAGIC